MATPHEKDPRWTAVDNYTTSHLHPSSQTSPSTAILEFARQNSEKNGLPDIAVSGPQGKFLKLQAQLLRAKSILEVGTLGGYSTTWLASANSAPKVITLEVDDKHATVARENLSHAGVGDRVEVRVGPALDSFPGIAEEVQSGKRGKFELVFIDADKENNWNYVDKAVPLCQPGALIIVDNIVRKGQLADGDVNNERIKGARRVVENVGKDGRLDGVVLQLVGEKSYDGILMIYVK